MAQPILINAGGYPVYNGQIAKFVTVQGHSMAVYDALNVQQFYFPNVLKYDPDQLRTQLSQSDGGLLIGYGSTTVKGALDSQGANITSINTSVTSIEAAADLFIDDFLPVGETYYDNAIQLALTASKASGKPIKFGPHIYEFQLPVVLNMDATGIKMYGAGVSRTELRFPNAAAGVTQLTIQSTADWYDFVWEGMSVRSAHAGVLCKIGRDSYADPLNVARFQDLAFLNGYNSDSSIGLYLNYVVNSNFIGVRANCYADGHGVNAGDALVIAQVGFCNFGSCSFGNAKYGILFYGGFSYGNAWNAVDVENVNICVSNSSTNAGSNTFIGGQFSLATQYMVDSPIGLTGNRLRFINPNISSVAVVVNPDAGYGVLIEGIRTDAVTPAMPANSTEVRNTTGRNIMVYVWGGTVASISINSFGIALTHGVFHLRPWDTISFSYSSAPAWNWRQFT